MKFYFYIFFVISTFSCSKPTKETIYVGYEPIMIFKDKSGNKTNLDTENQNKKWFYKNLLKIKNDSIFLDRIPITKIGNQTQHSSSDGGFFYYKGIKIKTRIELIEISCDYCHELISKNGKKIKRKLNGKITEKGIEINNVKFKEIKTSNYVIRSENLNVK
jgi:hypothetical protein